MSEEKVNSKYWIIVASKDHVEAGKEGGFAQASHGKNTSLKRMNQDDFVIYYSGKKQFGGAEKCQEFTALGKVADKEALQFHISPDFSPFRRKIEFLNSKDVPIRELLDDLEFVVNKKYWGYPFRTGFFEINEHDFKLISKLMLQK